jgi:hypothetical protein
LKNNTTISKFIWFDHQPKWATPAAVGYVGCMSSRRGPQRLGQRPRAQRVGGKAAVVAHVGWGLFVVRHGGRPSRRGPTAIGFCKTPCATTTGRPSLENCVKMIETNRKNIFSRGGPIDQPPAAPSHQVASRGIFRAKGRGGEGPKGISMAAPPKESWQKIELDPWALSLLVISEKFG